MKNFDDKNCNIINKDKIKQNNFSLFSLKTTNIADKVNNSEDNIRENIIKRAAADSGCTNHFISDRDIEKVENIVEMKT